MPSFKSLHILFLQRTENTEKWCVYFFGQESTGMKGDIMNVLIVFNHPYEKSYNNAVLKAALNGIEKGNHAAEIIHLDNENFDPVMREKDLKAFVIAQENLEESIRLLDPQVVAYKEKLDRADHIVFIFPIWWELMPALTKGFIDKIIFPGIAYDYNANGTGMKSRLPKLKGVTMITTMNTPSIAYRLIFGNAIKKALLLGTFWKIGIPNRKWINLSMVKFISEENRNKKLQKIERTFQNLKN